MEIIPVRYGMSSMITGLVTSVIERATEKGLELIIKADPDLPSELYGDEVRVRQVITNILTNAVKYTETGSITFTVGYELIKDEPDGVMINIDVTDTGIGIKEEDMKKLFSEFERIEEKRNRNVEGTGLGMSITKSLLEMMGSTLKVESAYGKGSRFYFSIKQLIADRTPMGDYETAYQALQKDRKRYNEKFTAPDAEVLVVDDNAMNRMVFKSLLKKTMIRIDEADSGNEGLSLMREKKYDLIFLDHMMPVKDGIETLKELKAEPDNPNLSTPVICLTANAISGARDEYIAAGFDDYLTKPIDSGRLEDMLIDYLPAERIQRIDPSSKKASKKEPHIKELDLLAGNDMIDVRAGISGSGSEDDYYEILRVFYESLDDKAKELEGFFENNDLENYTIAVHSMKSSLRITGAPQSGEKAEMLEMAGKAGDWEKIRANHADFMKEYTGFKEILAPVFEKAADNSDSGNGDDRPLADSETIRQAYDEIKNACEDLDTIRLEYEIEKLKSYRIPDSEKELFDKIVSAALQFDYDVITDLLS